MIYPTRAWLFLLALSTGSTAIASMGASGLVLTTALLGFSGLKAHLILKDFLGLRAAPGWLRGFDLGLALLILCFWGLALVG